MLVRLCCRQEQASITISRSRAAAKGNLIDLQLPRVADLHACNATPARYGAAPLCSGGMARGYAMSLCALAGHVLAQTSDVVAGFQLDRLLC